MSLTAQQLTSLKELYATASVNKLTHEECQEILFNQICDELDILTEDEIKYSFDEETLDELVDNVTTNSKELIYTDEQKRLTTLEELGG